jgi:hypothetical protein
LIAPATLLGGLVLTVAGCGSLLPSPGDVAYNVELDHQGSILIATVSPWPLDNSVAFFCLRQPGTAFSVENPSPPGAAGCTPAHVAEDGDSLIAKFDPASLDPTTAAAFAAQREWFLAVAGSRGPVSVATTISVLNIPAAP